jgi:hypothetical protein
MGQAAGAFGEKTAAYKAMAITEATIATYLAATKALELGPILGVIAAAAITAAGLANVASIVSAKDGGTFQNGKKVASFAGGGDFMVPPGYAGDNFPMMVNSGERVQVTPTGRVGDDARLLAELIGVNKATNKNIAMLSEQVKKQKLEVNLDGKTFVKRGIKPAENRLVQAGVKLELL